MDNLTGEVQRFEDERLDIDISKTLLVEKDLYVFTGGSPVRASKFTHFTNTEKLAKITLSSLPYIKYLDAFSICFVAGSIILTGGRRNQQLVPERKTYLMDVQTGNWL